jgi:hypothetical protein
MPDPTIRPANGATVDSPFDVDVTIPNPEQYLWCTITYDDLPSNDFTYDSQRHSFHDKPTMTFANDTDVTIKAKCFDSTTSAYSPESAVTVTVRHSVRAAPRDGWGGGGQVTITSPSPGAAVQCTFTANGTISNAISNNVSGCIIDTNGNSHNGTTTSQGTGTWSIQFTEPAGSLATCALKVWCTDDNTVFAQESLGGSGPHGYYS